MEERKNVAKNDIIELMFKAGAHFGYGKSRRHPSAKPFIFGSKNKVEIFDLEKTKDNLESAKNFVKTLAEKNQQILFVGGKAESREVIKNGAISVGMPYVSGRWVGGTLTNFPEIRKRVAKFEDLISKKENGELSKYTKKERLLIDREIERLKMLFFGIVTLKEMPKALFVVDSKKESNAVAEARANNIPVIALTGSDCDLKEVEFPIPGNDSSVSSIKFFVDEIAKAYKEGKEGRISGENVGYNILACIGNEAKLISGQAKGSKGVVTGMHGGIEHVLIDFPDNVLAKIAYGDKVQITAFGLGLAIENFPDIKMFNLDPALLLRINPKIVNGKIQMPVVVKIPPYLMGSGLGAGPVSSGDYDITMADEATNKKLGLDKLRFGDLVAIADTDNSFGRTYRPGAVTIGVVVHSDCVLAGHGPG